jgi:hypothetical protein
VAILSSSSAVFQRWGTIAAAVTADQGDASAISEARLQLIARFAATAVLAEQVEARLASGQKIKIAEYALLCSTLARLAQILGVDRKAHGAEPTLSEFLRSEEMEQTDE